jgi:uncharacterized phage-like protein YoqJ
MMVVSENTCCFFGHRKINLTEDLKSKLRVTMEKLIVDEKVDMFLFGSRSDFDDLCYEIVTELKEKHPHIKRVYVRAEYPFIDESYRNYILESYEDTYYPERMENAGRASYFERNQEMINQSDVCVVYYDENYAPPRRRNSRRDLADYQPKSGTKIAYDYAVRKGKTIINVL